jgi:cobalt-zinc-cadmium resistance protein CzcA
VVVAEAPSLPRWKSGNSSYPIERAMLGLRQAASPLALKLGLSMVTVVFDDSVPIYLARQLVAERLQQVIPAAARMQPALGLPATAFGELCEYTLRSQAHGLRTCRMGDQKLRTIPGVSEVSTWEARASGFDHRGSPCSSSTR